MTVLRTHYERPAVGPLAKGDRVDGALVAGFATARESDPEDRLLDPDLGADYLALADEVLGRIGLRDARRALKPLLAS